jgi:hypothetical protein
VKTHEKKKREDAPRGAAKCERRCGAIELKLRARSEKRDRLKTWGDSLASLRAAMFCCR